MVPIVSSGVDEARERRQGAPMHVRYLTALCFSLALALPACDSTKDAKSETKSADKKDDKKADAKGDAKADAKGEAKADAKAEPAAAAKVDLPAVGLKADAPAGTTVGDGIGGKGHMIQAEGFVVTVDPASDMTPKTIEDAKKEAEMYTPKNYKSEKLPDGFAVTFDNEGGMGANFFVQVRRDIGGKAYWCETTSSTAEQQAAVLAFCKSLKQ
jgi:hypothetical protein